jgi:hypothetical protein
MSDNKYMTFSMQVFLTLLAIVNTVISAKSLTLKVLTFILIYLHISNHINIVSFTNFNSKQ